MATSGQSPASTEDASFFSTTEGIVVLAMLAAIVLLLLLMIPVLYVTLRKCGVIKVGPVATTADRGSGSVWHTGKSKRTQTKLTGHDIEELQKSKPSLDDYKGKLPSKTKNSNSMENLDSRDNSPVALPRWRDVDPDWSDPWARRQPARYGYIRTDEEFVAGKEEDYMAKSELTNGSYFRPVR